MPRRLHGPITRPFVTPILNTSLIQLTFQRRRLTPLNYTNAPPVIGSVAVSRRRFATII